MTPPDPRPSDDHPTAEIRACLRTLAADPACVEARDRLDGLTHLAAPPWHFPMMADRARNAAYDAALRRAAPGRHVLDLGAGAGLLSLMAVRAGATRVTSCEAEPAVAEAAQAIAQANGLGDRITVHALRSEALEIGLHLPEPAGLLVTETFGSGLVTEGVLGAVADARRRLLAPGAATIPARASACGYLAGGEELEALFFSPTGDGYDLSAFDIFAPQRLTRHLDRVPHEVMSDDFAIFTFDLANDAPHLERRELTVRASRAGRCVAVVQWLQLDLDDHNLYANRPDPNAGPNGWMHVLYRLQTPIDVRPGDEVALTAAHDLTSMTIALAGGELSDGRADRPAVGC